MQQALARWLNFEQAVIVCAVAEDAQVDEAALTESFHRARATATSKPAAARSASKPSTARQVLQLRENVQLIHQPSESELFNLIRRNARWSST